MKEGLRPERRKEGNRESRDHQKDSARERPSRDKDSARREDPPSVLGSLVSRKRTSTGSASSILTTSSTSTVKPSKSHVRQASLSSSKTSPSRVGAGSSTLKAPPGRSVSAALQPNGPVPACDVTMASNPPTHTLGSTSSISRSNTVPSSFESRRSKRSLSNSRPSNISPQSFSERQTNQYPSRKGVYRERRDWESESNGDEELTPRPRRFPRRPDFDRSFSEGRQDNIYYPPPPPGYGGPPPPHRAFAYEPYFATHGYRSTLQGPPRRRRSHSRDSNASTSSNTSEDSNVFDFLVPDEQETPTSTMGLNSRTTTTATPTKSDRIVVKKRGQRNDSQSSISSTSTANDSDEASVASTLVDSGSNSPVNGPPGHRLFSPTGKPIRVVSTSSTRVFSNGPLAQRRSTVRPADSYRRFSGLTRVHLDTLERELRDLERQIARLEELDDLDDDDEDEKEQRSQKKKELISWAGARLMIYHQAIAAYKGLPDHDGGADFVDIRPEPKPEGFKGVIPYISSVGTSIWDFGVEKWNGLENRTRFYACATLGLLLAVWFRARFWSFAICFLTAVIWMNSSSRDQAKAAEAKKEKERLTEVADESPDCIVKKGLTEEPQALLPGSFESFGLPTEFGIDVPIGGLAGGLLGNLIQVGA